jgi:hypothetical protein
MKANSATGLSIAALLLVVLGCVVQLKSNSAVTEWQDMDPALAKDLAEVRELCPLGTAALAARDSLGGRCHLAHYYGPSLRASRQNGRYEAGAHDDWALVYETAHGNICLWLRWPSGADRSALDRAVVCRIGAMKQVSAIPNGRARP